MKYKGDETKKLRVEEINKKLGGLAIGRARHGRVNKIKPEPFGNKMLRFPRCQDIHILRSMKYQYTCIVQ